MGKKAAFFVAYTFVHFWTTKANIPCKTAAVLVSSEYVSTADILSSVVCSIESCSLPNQSKLRGY